MSNENAKNLLPRPPIVVVVGHVDHGKTTLLDYIRKTTVAAREAGNITQSIGAYEIVHTQKNAEGNADQHGRKITFIDTPGHEAFTKMRTRGAHAADLAILVVAADEGVKPQTEESVKILEESETPYVVAITKIDKPNADIEKVKQELTAKGVLLEGYGGHTSWEPVSTVSGEHVPELLDLILLAADLEHSTYSPGAPASGYVLECCTDRQRGIEVSVIVHNGTLRLGDYVKTETAGGKIRILENFLGEPVQELRPSAPALIVGFEAHPLVGETFTVSEPPEKREVPRRAVAALAEENGEAKIRLVLKAKDAGSLEALREIVNATSKEQPVKIIAGSVGDVTDNDVKFAISGKATVVAFGSRVDKGAKMLAESNRVKVVSSDIIYHLVKEVEEVLAAAGKPQSAGELEALAIFNQTKPERQVVGGKVTSGTFKNRATFEIVREGQTVGTGRVQNLQQQKKDVYEVREGNETGLLVNSETLIQIGDRLVIRE